MELKLILLQVNDDGPAPETGGVVGDTGLDMLNICIAHNDTNIVRTVTMDLV